MNILTKATTALSILKEWRPATSKVLCLSLIAVFALPPDSCTREAQVELVGELVGYAASKGTLVLTKSKVLATVVGEVAGEAAKYKLREYFSMRCNGCHTEYKIPISVVAIGGSYVVRCGNRPCKLSDIAEAATSLVIQIFRQLTEKSDHYQQSGQVTQRRNGREPNVIDINFEVEAPPNSIYGPTSITIIVPKHDKVRWAQAKECLTGVSTKQEQSACFDRWFRKEPGWRFVRAGESYDPMYDLNR